MTPTPPFRRIRVKGRRHHLTASTAAAEALAYDANAYRQMFDNNRAVKLVIDPADGRIKNANPAAAAFYGYTREQLLSMRIQDINILPEAEVQAEMQRAVTQDRTFFEFRHRLASGEIRDVDVFSSPVDMPEGRCLYSIVTDVTGKREGETRYHALFEQTNDAVFILDLEGNHIQVNRRAAAMLGYQPQEMVDLSYRDLAMPEEHHLSANVLERLLAGEHIPPYERTFRRKDGSPVPVEINAEVVRDGHGAPLHIQSIVRDITERKHAEEALRQSEARLRALVTAIPDLMFRNRGDGTFIDYHASDFSELYAPPEQFMNNTIEDVLPPPVAGPQMAAVRRALATGQITIHEYTLPVQGKTRHFESRIVPSGEDEVLTISRDVTELWEARRELELAKTRLEFAMEIAGVSWWEMDLAAGTLQFDVQKVQGLGYDVEAISTSAAEYFVNLVHPDDYSAIAAATAALTTGRARSFRVDLRLKAANEEWRWFNIGAEMAESEAEQSVVRGFVVDINQRKAAEQRELALALEKERVNLLVTFINTASHEFRTPLTSINTSAYLMSRSDDPQRRHSKAQDIDMQVKRITKLLDMLMWVVKLESTTDMAHEPVDLVNLFEVTCANLMTQYGDQPQLQCEIERGLPPIIGDTVYLAQALWEVLDNAYRFTPPDGSITIMTGMGDAGIWVEIRDTGPGIAPDALPHIFETFWRQDVAHTTPGFGLGLAIAQKITTLHGGHIQVDSQPGQGTRLRITLPTAPPGTPVRT